MTRQRLATMRNALALMGISTLLTACYHQPHRPIPPRLDGPAEWSGTLEGPNLRQQMDQVRRGGNNANNNTPDRPTVYVLVLEKPADLDDKSTCGPQRVERIGVEAEGLAPIAGKEVRLRAHAYCVTEDGKAVYQLKNASIVRVVMH